MRQKVFVGQGDAVGQRAVGVERHDDALLEIAPKWMVRHRRNDVCMHVARQAHLERNLAGDDFLEQRRIFREPRAVPNPLRTYLVERLVNRMRSVTFTRVTRARHPVRGGVLERRPVIACGEAAFGAREIECGHPSRPILGRDARELERLSRWLGPHGADDQPNFGSRFFHRPLYPRKGSFDGLGQGQSGTMEQRRIAHLDIPNVLGGLVHDEFVRHALERRGGLQDGEGDDVFLEVLLEVLRVAHQHRLRQLIRCLGGQVDALRPGQLEHRRGPQRAIEMHVQLGLGPAAQGVFRQPRLPFASRRHHDPIHRACLTHRVAGVDGAAGGVGHVGRTVEETGQAVVGLGNRIAHARATRDVDCPVVDENPHQRSVR